MLPRCIHDRRRQDEYRSGLELAHRLSIDINGRSGERHRHGAVAPVQGDRQAAVRGRGWRMPVNVNRRFVCVGMLAGCPEVQVVRLPLGEVVVERGARQRCKQRHDRRERKERADAPDNRLTSHHLKL